MSYSACLSHRSWLFLNTWDLWQSSWVLPNYEICLSWAWHVICWPSHVDYSAQPLGSHWFACLAIQLCCQSCRLYPPTKAWINVKDAQRIIKCHGVSKHSENCNGSSMVCLLLEHFLASAILENCVRRWGMQSHFCRILILSSLQDFEGKDELGDAVLGPFMLLHHNAFLTPVPKLPHDFVWRRDLWVVAVEYVCLYDILCLVIGIHQTCSFNASFSLSSMTSLCCALSISAVAMSSSDCIPTCVYLSFSTVLRCIGTSQQTTWYGMITAVQAIGSDF